MVTLSDQPIYYPASLMELLASKRELIIQRWLERVEDDKKIPSSDQLERFILRDDMPGILRQLIIALGHHLSGTIGFNEAVLKAAESEYAEAHLQSRLRHGYQLPEALREYGQLRNVIIETWLEARGRSNSIEFKVLNASIDELMVNAATQILDENLAAKDLFLSKLSHELNSPIMAIVANLDRLRAKCLEIADEDVIKSLEAVNRNVDLLLLIASDLNELSKIVLGKFRLRVARVYLSAVLTSVYEWALPLASARNINLILDFNKDVEVEIDETKIHQALLNLVNNSLRYTPSGGSIKIHASANSMLELSVSDDGDGIDETILPTLFDWPSLDKPQDPKKGGLGLGLPIVREIAELHGGTVSAKNNLNGKGAEIALRLPLPKAVDTQSGNR